MKSYKFTLQSVLNYRNMQLDEAKKEYAAALAEVVRQEGVLNGLYSRTAEVNGEYNRKKSAGITVSEAHNYELYLGELHKLIKKETAQLRRLQEAAAKKQGAVVSANIEFRSIDKIRENRLEEYNDEYRKYEEKLVEEFVSNTSSHTIK